MDVAYIRATKSGPREAEQRAAAVAAGVDPANPDAWYVEPAPKRGRPATFEERALAIRALRDGDRLVIHSAPRLGATEAEIRDILEQAAKPLGRVKLGSFLAAIAREAGGLTDEEHALLESVRSKSAARAVSFE
jgi:plasmid stability protein